MDDERAHTCTSGQYVTDAGLSASNTETNTSIGFLSQRGLMINDRIRVMIL